MNPENSGIEKMMFSQCTFSQNARLADANIDTLEFERCINFEKGTILRGLDRNKPIVLKFDRSDLTNLDFDYDQRYELYKWPSREANESVFQQLLVKFENEKKTESYKRVDIEYSKYRNNQLVNTLNYIWWNFGYEKWLIILWTIFFLSCFTIINMIFWKNFRKIYHVEKESDITNSTGGEKFIKILLFTSLIFFSLRINFEKLSFKHTGRLVYFFFQYITGLVCLFFIANAILKL